MAFIGLAAALVMVAGVALWQFFIRPVSATHRKGRSQADGPAPARAALNRRAAFREHE